MQIDQPGAAEEKPGRGLFGSIKFFGGIGALGLLAIFFLQNMQDAELNILWMTWETPMIFALAIAAGIGAIAAWLFSGFRGRARRRAEARRNK
jgi:uncharacterized integral membrane protein